MEAISSTYDSRFLNHRARKGEKEGIHERSEGVNGLFLSPDGSQTRRDLTENRL